MEEQRRELVDEERKNGKRGWLSFWQYEGRQLEGRKEERGMEANNLGLELLKCFWCML